MVQPANKVLTMSFKIIIVMFLPFVIIWHIVGGVTWYRVNKKMPQGAGIPYFTVAPWITFKEYRRVYPGGKLHWLLVLSTAAVLLCFLAFVVAIFVVN